MKTYCISDVHGHYENLKKFKDSLNKDDKVFVLGDVVDKGDNPIECLKLIMDDDRFTMLLGNHEYMMFQFLSCDKNDLEYEDAYERWIDWNSGNDTYLPYLQLDKNEQKRIYDFIKSLPLNIPNLEVNGRRFYLVHSCPHDDVQLTMKDVDYSDLKIVSYVWDRIAPIQVYDEEGRIIIAGHTPVQEYLGLRSKDIKPVFDDNDDISTDIKKIANANYIDIDGGLATRLPIAKLIVLCLDDLSYKLY